MIRSLLFAALLAPLHADEPVGFNESIRPLLSDTCIACHGFDANTREAGLRLDVAEAAYEKRESGAALVPGDPAASLAWQRITSTDPDLVMPPPEAVVQLSDSDKEKLQRWIEQGAKYESHWSFGKVERPEVPEGEETPLDFLIGRRLAADKLDFSPEADRRTLIRRLSLDLRGLSPQPEEVAAFLNDRDPDAWIHLVDRFIADPAFGERMAWPWLDAARYADTNGYQGDAERTMWPWRDWVIDAINRNLPYDDFTVWQIAGDLLPDATFEQKLATGFLRNHAINGEGGRIPEENRVEYVMDMSETVGTAWMALTMNCCRCHDHKYDPISQKEYYGLFDFFNQTPVSGSGGSPQTPPVVSAPTPEQTHREKELLAAINDIEPRLAVRAMAIKAGQANWETASASSNSDGVWSVLNMDSAWSKQVNLKLQGDHSALGEGGFPARGDYEVKLSKLPARLAAIRLEVLRHPSLPGLSSAESGNFVLTGFEATLVMPDGSRQPLPIGNAEATFEQGGHPATSAIDGNPATGWAVWKGELVTQEHAAVFHLGETVDVPAGASLEIQLRHQSRHAKHLIGRFRLWAATEAPSHTGLGDLKLIQAIQTPNADRSKEQNDLIRLAYLTSDAEFSALDKQLAAWRIELDELRKAIPKVMVMAEQKKRRDAFVLAGGSYEQQGEKVVAHTPSVLPPLETSGDHASRLDLARWLVSRDHPLTARVTVNRIWQEFFGIGFVKSPEDFGVQSEIPKQLRALDWLAADFMDGGWDFKRLVRTIVTSRTYRQASGITPAALELDPENRLVARGPRFRLPAWMIRDQTLAASGMLVSRVGGEPVKPWQPPGLWEEVTFGEDKKIYVPDTGEKLRRRSLYTFWRRISAPPMFFDSAKREMCEVGVTRTNSPLHALSTLNDPIYVEAARALVGRSAGDSEKATLSRAFETVLARPPGTEESAILLDNYEIARSAFQADPAAADAFLAIGETPRHPSMDPVTEAALATVCLSILNTDEALTKE